MDKSRSFDKSRSTQGTETEDTVKTLNKSRSISADIFPDKITKTKSKEIDISKDDSSLSCMSGHGASVSGESTDKQLILRKNKRKHTLDTSIKRKEIIQVQDNPSKRVNRIVYLMQNKIIIINTSTI